MKLHLPNKLRAALLACAVAASTPAWADVTVSDALLTVSTGGGSYTATADATTTITSVDFSAMSSAGNDVTLTAGENGVLDIDVKGIMSSWAGTPFSSDLTLGSGVDLNVSDGGMVLNGTTLTVEDGAALNIAGIWSANGSNSTLSIGSNSTVTIYQYGTQGSGVVNDFSDGNLSVELAGGTLAITKGNISSSTTFSGTGSLTLADGATATITMAQADETTTTITYTGGTMYGKVTGTGNYVLGASSNIYCEMDFTGNLTVKAGTYNFGYASWGTSVNLHNKGDISIESGASITVDTYTTAGNTETVIANTGDITIAGTLTVNTGTIKNEGAIIIEEDGKLTLNSNSTLELAQAISNSGTLTMAGTVSMSADSLAKLTALSSAYSDTTSGFIQSTYQLVSGDGTLSFGSENVTSKSISIAGGTASLGADGVLTYQSSSYYVNEELEFSSDMGTSIVVNSGGTLKGVTQKNVSGSVGISLYGGTLNIDSQTTLTTSGDRGTVTLLSTTDADGNVTYSNNTINIGSSSTIYSNITGTGNLTIEGASSNNICSTIDNVGNLTLKGTIQFGHSDGSAAAINTDGNVTIDGGSITLTSGSTGATIGENVDKLSVINSGKLTIQPATFTHGISLNSGTLDLGNTTLSGAVTLEGGTNTIQGNADAGTTLASDITGTASSLTLKGANASSYLKVSGDISYTGDLKLNGLVEVQSGAKIQNTGNVEVTSGTIKVLEGATFSTQALTISGGTLTASAALTAATSTSISSGAALVLNASGSSLGAMNNSGTLTIGADTTATSYSGTGTYTVADNKTFTVGTTSGDMGTDAFLTLLSAGDATSAGHGGITSVLNKGSFWGQVQLAGTHTLTDGVDVKGKYSLNKTLNLATDNKLNINIQNGGSLDLGSNNLVMYNNANITVEGGTLSASTIFVGGKESGSANNDLSITSGSVQAGTLSLQNTDSTLTLNGGELKLGSGGINVGEGSSAGDITLSSGTLGASASWSTSLAVTLGGGANGLTIASGENTITLSGATTFAGTVENTGNLELSGTLSLADDATLTEKTTAEGGSYSHGKSGFKGTSQYVVLGGENASLTVSSTTLGDKTLTVANGSAYFFTKDDSDTTYYVNEDMSRSDDQDAMDSAGSISVKDSTLNLAYDGSKTITLNNGTLVNAGRSLSSGSITLEGGTNTLSMSSCTLSAAVSGKGNLVLETSGKDNGDNFYISTSIANDGNLTLQTGTGSTKGIVFNSGSSISTEGKLISTADVQVNTATENISATGGIAVKGGTFEVTTSGTIAPAVTVSGGSVKLSNASGVKVNSLTAVEASTDSEGTVTETAVATISGGTYAGTTITKDGISGGKVTGASVTVSEDFTLEDVTAEDCTFTINDALSMTSGSSIDKSSKLIIAESGSLKSDGSLVLTGDDHEMTLNISNVSFSDGVTILTSGQLSGLSSSSNATILLSLGESFTNNYDTIKSYEGSSSLALVFTSSVSAGVSTASAYSEDDAVAYTDSLAFDALTFQLDSSAQSALSALGYNVSSFTTTYDASTGSVTMTIAAIPEPTTATLSLLALAALAARRRRK